MEIGRVGCERGRIDGTGRGAADYFERIGRPPRQHMRYRAQETNLVSGTRTATCQYQAYFRCGRRWIVQLKPRPAKPGRMHWLLLFLFCPG
jgi:hypothetical protein